jgi:ketosteroid isomerase-like protein
MRTLTAMIFVMLSTLPPALAQTVALIQAQNDRLASAFNRADAAAVRAMYTDDAAVLPAGGEMVQGEKLLPFWRAVVERIGDFRRVSLDVQPLGPDAAREIGRFSFRTKRELRETSGKYVVVWRRIGDEWKRATDIWNTDR